MAMAAPATPTEPEPMIHHDLDADDDPDENDVGDRRPLLSSFFQKSVKMGPFSIRYRDPAAPRAKPSRLYHGEDPSGSYRDFGTSRGHQIPGDRDEEDADDSEAIGLLRRKLLAMTRICCCGRADGPPLRVVLLAFHLAFTLAAFWILDSIKEPTLATLVRGDLGKHQPRAKMTSFVVVLALAMGMEYFNQVKERRRKQLLSEARGPSRESDANAELEQSWRERDLPTSMKETRWKKMGIRTSALWDHFRWHGHGDSDVPGSSKITTLAFYVVGSLYIHFFITVAVALKQHPSYRSQSNVHTSTEDVEDGNNDNDWHYQTLGYALFALIESYGSVSITIFWAFANSHLTLEAAERHYGSIVAMAQAGAIAGSTISTVLGKRRSHENIEEGENDASVTPLLIFVACGCIGAGMAIMTLYSQLFSRSMRGGSPGLVRVPSHEGLEEEQPATLPPKSILHQSIGNECEDQSIFKELLGGVRLIFRHNYLTLVLAVSVVYEIALTCMHYEMNLIGLDRFGVGIGIVGESELHDVNRGGSNEGITYIQFMGWYGQTVNILSLFLSFYAFPHLIKHYGLRITIRIFPTVLLLVTIFAFVLFPRNLYFLFISLSLCKALTYSVHDPSEEVLYMPTSDDAKFRAKFWIDVVGQRIAKAIGSVINNFAGSVEGIVKYGSLPSVLASLALWLACYQVGILFDGLIKSGAVVGVDGDECEAEGLELCEGLASESDHDDET
ncbi:hypothetical protein ACHAWF_006509 [Thalassiosira exigua]